MPDDADNQRLTRRLFGAMALFQFGWAAMVVWNGHVRISGRRGPAVDYWGGDALHWAGLLACTGMAVLGIALYGILLQSRGAVAVWMSVWLFTGVALVLSPIVM